MANQSNLKIGTKVAVTNLTPEDNCVAAFISGRLGQIGTVQSAPDISGSLWIEFTDGTGDVFYPEELTPVA